jgi:hypothetical protein
MKILIDHPQYQSIFTFLNIEGHSPIELKDCEDPIKKYNERGCDGAIMDLSTGYESAEKLCKLENSIVLTTSNTIYNKNGGIYENHSKRIRANGHIVGINSVLDIIDAIKKAKG